MNPDDFLDVDLPTLLRRTAARHPQRTAIKTAEHHVSFEAFDRLSDRAAAGLAARGVSPGDRIGLYCPNSADFAVAYFGILKAGATAVPLNLLLNPKEGLAYILNDAGARGLIFHASLGEPARILAENTAGLEFRVCIGEPQNETDIPWGTLLEQQAPAPDISFDPARDLAVILYTSGTTGRPKGAMLSHRNLAFDTASALQALQLQGGEDTLLVVLPMFHAFAATVGMLMPLLHGLSFVPVPRFEPEAVVASIERSGATVFLGVPSMYNVLLRLPPGSEARLSSLRLCVSGGAAMPVEIMQQFEQRYGIPVYEGDGPTECGPVTCINPVGGVRKPASVGLPIPGVSMQIRDERGKELPRNEIGEICVRGANVMRGYWNLPEATAESFFGDWFRTGDLGYEDDEGYFHIVDRKKDMIIINGMNVYPRMVEEVLYRHPAIREAAVVGEPNELHGEIPVAYLSLKADADADSAEIRAFCRDHLGRHEVPRKIFFLDELPKNAAGKILKRELRLSGELERGIDSRRETD